MDNVAVKKISTDKDQSSDQPIERLRDPNMILPQSQTQNNAKKTVDSLNPLEIQMKSDPVILRSFNKDLSEAMLKKKESVSIKDIKSPQVPEISKISQSSKIPTASKISFLKKPPLPDETLSIQKQKDKKNKLKPSKSIPTAPTPNVSGNVVSGVVTKKEEEEEEKLEKSAVTIGSGVVNPADAESYGVVKEEKKENFSLEIFPKPPQVLQSSKKDLFKNISVQ